MVGCDISRGVVPLLRPKRELRHEAEWVGSGGAFESKDKSTRCYLGVCFAATSKIFSKEILSVFLFAILVS